jgi:ABC-type nitrate/sulfonate/bicarbonate transport system ATPase subunit
MALYPYSYGDTLLKIDDICLSASADGTRLLEKEEPNSRPILKHVSAEIKDIIRTNQIQGQIVGFIGPSGIGKTQLFRIIAGLNKPTSGKVLLPGNREVKPGDIGVVAQNYPLFQHRTVLSNLMLSERKEKDQKVAHDKVLEFLNEFGLADKAFLYPAQLSGGQRQRIAIIQQILCSEHFLLMDEPFSGLDIIVEDKATQLILKVANMNDLNTVIVVTHDISAAVSIADHIWALGREHDSDGNPIPGASIVKTYDLIEANLCWEQWDPRAMIKPAVSEFIRYIKNDFYQF